MLHCACRELSDSGRKIVVGFIFWEIGSFRSTLLGQEQLFMAVFRMSTPVVVSTPCPEICRMPNIVGRQYSKKQTPPCLSL